MYSIIGLGNCGCEIAKKFEYFPQYTVYYIDSEERPSERFFKIPHEEHPEKYEQNCPDVSQFLQKADNDICFILGGSGNISACSLRILEKIKDRNITIIYIRPDIELLTGIGLMQEKVTFNVLQEYSRSGLFKNIILIHNNHVADIIGDIPIKKYYDIINDMISATLNMINVFDNSEAVISSDSPLSISSRIATVSIMDIESGNEKFFYPLSKIKEKRYYYAISENDLETKGSLLKNITEQVKKTSKSSKTNFGIFSTNYDQNFCYILNFSSEIQK
tara:strand:+ start:134 stop:961 length:828 start_codon:yes stop_codon:yes gene_type:complete